MHLTEVNLVIQWESNVLYRSSLYCSSQFHMKFIYRFFRKCIPVMCRSKNNTLVCCICRTKSRNVVFVVVVKNRYCGIHQFLYNVYKLGVILFTVVK
jgi:hypothetical protein